MIKRRKLVIGIGLSATLAGCSGSQSADQSDGDAASSENQSEDQSQAETSDTSDAAGASETLPETSIDIDNMKYGFGGLTTWIRLDKETEGDRRVRISVKAYSDDEVIAEASQWRTFVHTTGAKLNLESISDMGEYGIDDVTKFVIQGRTQKGKTATLRTLSNDDLKETIDSTKEISYGSLY